MLDNIINDLETKEFVSNIYFSQKLPSRYETFSPNIASTISKEIKDLMVDYLEKFKEYDVVDFNPTGCRDLTIEVCDYNFLGNYGEIMSSFNDADTVTTDLDPDKLTFYCLELTESPVSLEKEKVYIFRRITKFKKLNSKGILAKFNGNQLNKLVGKMFGIDGEVDLLIYKEKVYILSHYSLERIFRIDNAYQEKANDFLGKINTSNIVNNFDQFAEDCLNDKRYKKTLSKMLAAEINLNDILSNFSNVEDVINLFSLEIETKKLPTPQIVYTNKNQIMDILRIINDSYLKSLIKSELVTNDV